MSDLDPTAQLPPTVTPLFGRDEVVRVVAQSSESALLVTGDSGTGKTEVLRAAQQQTSSAASPPPITVMSGAGSLQRSLLAGLGDAVAEIIEQRGMLAEIGQRLTEAAKRLAADSGREALKVLTQAVLLKVKEKVGADAVDLVTSYIHELGEVDHEGLLARINAAADPSVAETILALAGEVATVSGEDNPVVITLDGAEVLGDDDRRLLQDLVTKLPVGVRLRIGFGTYTADDRDHVESLRVAGGQSVREIAIEGITEDAIKEWLAATELDTALAGELHQQTDGYPFYLDDLIVSLHGGAELEALAKDADPATRSDRYERFVGRTKLAWNALDAGAQAVAIQLAVLPQPLPTPTLQELCNMGPADWAATTERLRRARILSSIVNGVPWFHPIRKQAVLDLLGETEREQLDAATRQAISSIETVAAHAPELTANIALLAAASPELLADSPRTQAAVDLTTSQLSVAAALLDLLEPASRLLNASHVLQHARDFFGGQGDLASTIQALEQAEFINVIDTERGVFINPQIEPASNEATVIQGRALLELGRLPLPGLVSSIFGAAISPRTQPFQLAVYGMGRARLLEAIQTNRNMSRAVGELIVPRGQGHFLLIRARFHDRPVSAHLKFASAALRDRAGDQTERLAIDVLGGRFEVDDVLALPDDAIPSDRFLNVIERAYGRSLNRVTLDQAAIHPLDLSRYMEVRVQGMQLIHDRSSESERRALGLEEPASIHWTLLKHDGRYNITEGFVMGGTPRAVQHDELAPTVWQDPYRFFRFAEAFGLGEGERLYRLNYRMSASHPNSDPVVEAAAGACKEARMVNAAFAQVRVDMEPEALRTRLLDARKRELSDALALHDMLAGTGLVAASPVPRALLLGIEKFAPPYVGGKLGITTLEAESLSGEEEVYVMETGVTPSLDWDEQVVRYTEQFGVGVGRALQFGDAEATHGIASLLGFQPVDILLVDAENNPADAW